MTAMSPKRLPPRGKRSAVIAADLRAQIERGELRPGDKVPSRETLAERYGVSPMTAQRAVEELRAEGLVLSYADRRGTIVREYAPLLTDLTAAERIRLDDERRREDDWAARVRAQDRVPGQEVWARGDVPAAPWMLPHLPERVGLDVAVGEPVMHRERRRYEDDRPVQLSDSWFPAWVADTPMLADPTRQPLREDGDVVLPGGILAAIGLPQVRVRGRITGQVATPVIRRAMDLPRGTLLLVRSHVGYDDRGRPVRLQVDRMPTDRNVLGYEMDL